MPQNNNIVVFSSHSDDFVLGAGGTIAKYTKEGKKVLAIVFSYGEMSHPWLKESVVQKIRAQETVEASKVLRCKSMFFDLKEGKFIEEYKHKKLEEEMLKILQHLKPSKIFTHSSEDPHPDHRSIHQITLNLYPKLSWKPELYTYSIWNPVSFKTNYPSLYINIKDTFSLKWKSIRTFKSQQFHILYPLIVVFWNAIKDGIHIKSRFAERFFRIR